MEKNFGSPGGFEPPTFRLTAEPIANLSALSGVAYKEKGVILASLAAPNPAPKKYSHTAGDELARPTYRELGLQTPGYGKPLSLLTN
jgi:hypothetical protein